MAANLSRNLSNITDITKLMTECQRMNLNVLGPDVNESFIKFTTNKNGNIRFGMGAIKGVGAGAAQDIINARKKHGEFKNIFEFVENVNLQTVNKKNLEALAIAGAFDNLDGIKRSSLFSGDDVNDSTSFIEKLIKYGNRAQLDTQSAQQSLFGAMAKSQAIKKPDIPQVEEWPKLVLLEKEKSLIGIYLTAHPLDDYRLELESFCSRDVFLKDLNNDIDKFKEKELAFGGMVTSAREGIGKTGKPFSSLTLTDYTDSKEFMFFGQDYVNFSRFCKTGLFIMIKGKVQKSYRGEQMEFRITGIELLSEVRKNYVKSITINLPVSHITAPMIELLEKITLNNKGKVLLKFNIYDPESNMNIQMFSRTTRIELTDEMLKFLNTDLNMSFRIN